MHGYCGRLLAVDLTARRVEERALPDEAARLYIGGSGLAARLFFDAVAPALRAARRRPADYPDPLGPDNPLIIMTGPLTGTRLVAAARWAVAARSPLTGIWGECNVGGSFGAELKSCGYDGIVIVGRAAAPAYLLIAGGRASLEPAGDLWGRDCYETEDALAARHGAAGAGRRPRTMCIGPAGENLVRFACIMHDKHHAAGRTGLGAVMGAKRLKAVVAQAAPRAGAAAGPTAGAAPHNAPAPYGAPAPADPAALDALVAALRARAADSMIIKTLTETGTIASMDLGSLIGDVPVKNFSRGAWDGFERLTVDAYGRHLVGTSTCYGCPVGCFRKVDAAALGHVLKGAPGAEYETLAMFGANLLIDDLPAILVAGEVANRLGLDTISAGATIAFAYEAADRGLLDRLAAGWGDPRRLVELLADIAHRRDAGALLADGSAALARRIGDGAEAFLCAVKGLEAPAHDPRAAHGLGIAYASSPRGACHMQSLMFGMEMTGFLAPEAGIDYDGNQQSSAGKGALNKAAQDLDCVFGQSALLCHLGGNVYRPGDLVAALNAVTGLGLTLADVLECGARIWHLKRGIGNLYGMGRADDRLPPRLVEPLSEGGAADSTPDMEAMLAEWYQARGLDPDGRPRRDVLEGLGLAPLAALLWDN